MPASSSQQPEAGTFRILHVDDDPEFSEMASILLKREDERFDIVQAPSASIGLDKLSEQAFDCIISDYDMPGCDGIRFLEKVREEFPELPFILFTGKGTEEVASDAISAGVTDYLQKQASTCQYTVLANTVSNAIEHYRSSQMVEQREQELARIERRYQAVFNDPNILVGSIDTDGTVLDINQTALDYIDLTIAEIAGKPFWETPWFDHSEDLQQEVREWIDRAVSGEYVEFEVDIVRPTGEPYTVEGVFRPVTNDDEEVVSLLISDRDITERKEREKQLEQYVQIIETMDDVAFVVDDEWTVSFTNDSILEYFDIPIEALEGQPVMSLADEYLAEEDDPARFEQSLERAFERKDASASPERVELTLDTDSGQMTFEYQFSPLVSDGETRAVVITMRDITKHIRHAEQLRALSERSQMLMSADTREQIAEIGIEATREILELDANAIHLHDTEQSALVPVAATDTVYDLIGDPPVFTPENSIAWRAYEQGEALSFDDIRNDPDIYNPKTPIRSELYLPLGNQGILLVGSPTVAAFDEQDFMLGRLLAANIASALDQVTQTERLRAREAELTRQNNQLEEFASIVSHDLRNPLGVATGRFELLQEDLDPDNEHVAPIDHAFTRIETLIEEILTLTREGQQVEYRDAIRLSAIVSRCWAMVETGDAELTIEDDLTFEADPDRLNRLFENLFRNAIEHGGSDVTVTVGVLDDRTGFYVADDGPGIPTAERENVFAAGYTTSETGTGLGLAIVSEIAAAYGWEIRVTESAAGGARFEFGNIALVE